MSKKWILKTGKVVLAAVAGMALIACSSGKGMTEKQTETATVSLTEQQTKESSELSESKDSSSQEEAENISADITLAAAASLEKVMTDNLIPMFNEKYPNVKVTGTYDSSGKLQAQIEEGAEVDIFFSAAKKQMNTLLEKELIKKDSVVELLKNNIVLITNKDKEGKYSEFSDITKSEIIAIGDPESVPAGQYAKTALSNLGLWEEVEAKLSLGSSVTEVLNWVAQDSAELGIVYATDAYKLKDEVSIIDVAPKGSVEPAVYPVGITSASKEEAAVKLFIDFLQSKEAKEVFVNKGFIVE